MIGDHVLRASGQMEPHPVPFPDAQFPQGISQSQHLPTQVVVGNLAAVEMRGRLVREPVGRIMQKILDRDAGVTQGKRDFIVVVALPGSGFHEKPSSIQIVFWDFSEEGRLPVAFFFSAPRLT